MGHSKDENKKKNKVNTKKINSNVNKEVKDKKKKKHSKVKIIIRVILIIILLLLIIGAGIFAGIFFSDKWGITKDTLTLSKINTVVFDKDGKEIATVAGDEKRKIVALNDMPEDLKDAFVSIEDERFYQHHGVDIKRTLGATVSYAIHKGNSSYGGSTITQQLVKNLMKDKDDNGVAGMQRKVREMARAYQVEKMLSKDQILELYLNLIFMGGDVYGVELGSQYYFAKDVKDLDLAQCAFLAGINHSPNRYNPYGDTDNTEAIKKRTKTVLAKMKELGKITDDEYNKAEEEVNNGLTFKEGSTSNTSTMSYLARAALNQVIKQYAENTGLDEDFVSTKIYGGGYKIYTTQDSNIQSNMEDIYKDDTYIVKGRSKDDNGNLINTHTQSAMVVIDHKTGNVVGCVGGLGTDVNSNGLNRATQSTRQPGSSIKPIASIAPALEAGIITAGTVYDDSPTSFGNYSVKDDSNNYQGLCTVRKAIEVSANVPEVKIMSELGPANSIEFLRKMGVSSLVTAKENSKINDENLAIVLGGLSHGISPLEMAAAYATIANGGVYITPTFYTKVEDSTGNTVLEPTQEKTRVMSEGNAFIEQDILTGPVTGAHGTATSANVLSGIETCGKTGTTTSNRDRWFCGFTPYYAAATWYGYDNDEVIHTSGNTSVKIWARVMKAIHKGLSSAKFEKPSNIVQATICLDSGKVATSSCARTYTEYFVKGTVPDACEGHKTLKICTDTGKIATEFCPNVEEKTFLVKPEKENTTAWQTSDSSKYDVPTETCTEHTKKMVKVPNVVGLSKEAATSKLKDSGLEVDVKQQTSTKSEGIVLEQSQNEGTEVSTGTKITITISKKETSKPKENNIGVETNNVSTGNTIE